jgi:phosphoribosylglycinamide formyltransferase-1
MLSKVKLGVLVSGGGSNLQAIIDACENGILSGKAEVSLVVSSSSGAFALQRAARHGIEGIVLKNSSEMIERLKTVASLVCLAGYMRKLDDSFIEAFRGKIINIHPALLPKFGGRGMYGHFVHEAVVAAGEKESGATVHFVDEEYDHGAIILQEKVTVLPSDKPEDLAKRVLAIEHKIYPMAIAQVIDKVINSVEAK